MIRYEHRDRLFCPRVYCDVCKKVITDASKANARWNDEDEGSPEVVHAHKGECSISLNRTYQFGDDLDRHFAQLTCNVGLDFGKKQLKMTVDPTAGWL